MEGKKNRMDGMRQQRSTANLFSIHRNIYGLRRMETLHALTVIFACVRVCVRACDICALVQHHTLHAFEGSVLAFGHTGRDAYLYMRPCYTQR